MNGKPLVSAIIVNWNGAEHLRICLPSLLSQSFPSLEVIVVDNASKDDSAEVAREFQVRWLCLEKNLGLAPALNRGAAIALGEFLLFVNNDMRFDREFVSALVETLRSDDSVFAADGMQFNWDGSSPGHLATRLTNIAPGKKASVEFVPGLYFYPEDAARTTPVFMGSAACMLVRRSLFDRVEGFDNRLPLGYEDVEICWRAGIQGWKILYAPQAICWHRVGSSGRSPEGARMNFRGILKGRLLLATKLLPLRYTVFTWFLSAAGLAKDMGHLRWRAAADRISILAEVAALALQLLSERRTLFRSAGTTPRTQLQRFLDLSVETESRTWVHDLEREGGR